MKIQHNLIDQVDTLKGKFRQLYIHQKMLRALENYDEAIQVQHNGYLSLIKRGWLDGFLDEETSHFLNHMISKKFAQEDYLNWTYKTRWLKKRMAEVQKEHAGPRSVQPDMFDAARKRMPIPNIPVGLLGKKAPNFRRTA